MEEQETFKMIDELGRERDARILNIIEINHQEYVVYAVSQNEDEDSIFAAKLIKDQAGNEDIVPIDNEEEKRVVYDAVRTFINELDES